MIVNIDGQIDRWIDKQINRYGEIGIQIDRWIDLFYKNNKNQNN